MRVGTRAWAIALGCVLTVAGCSGSSSPHRTAPRTAPASTTAPKSMPPSSPSSSGAEAVPAATITATAVRTVSTAHGTVGYRSFGSGPALLLITGFSGSIDSWDPRFLGLLAASHRVVVVDNAGVGRTSALPSPLTIDAMAQQVGAFIDAIHLGAVPVLGWSMGGMIAQALAVLHPTQVSRLILAASFAGNGKALPVPAAAAAALAGGQPAAVLATLFPADRASDAQSYGLSIISYPGYYEAPKSVDVEQGAAIARWSAGTDPAGRRVQDVRVPTLVVDGSEDAVVPIANTRALAALIRGAKLHLYPGAGHAFLFQDAATFVPQLDAFLG